MRGTGGQEATRCSSRAASGIDAAGRAEISVTAGGGGDADVGERLAEAHLDDGGPGAGDDRARLAQRLADARPSDAAGQQEALGPAAAQRRGVDLELLEAQRPAGGTARQRGEDAGRHVVGLALAAPHDAREQVGGVAVRARPRAAPRRRRRGRGGRRRPAPRRGRRCGSTRAAPGASAIVVWRRPVGAPAPSGGDEQAVTGAIVAAEQQRRRVAGAGVRQPARAGIEDRDGDRDLAARRDAGRARSTATCSVARGGRPAAR